MENSMKTLYNITNLLYDKTVDQIPFDQFLKWIEHQLPKGYTMKDIGESLIIEHVVPLSSFDLTDEQQFKDAMSWRNLRPVRNYRSTQSYRVWATSSQEIKARHFLKNIL